MQHKEKRKRVAKRPNALHQEQRPLHGHAGSNTIPGLERP